MLVKPLLYPFAGGLLVGSLWLVPDLYRAVSKEPAAATFGNEAVSASPAPVPQDLSALKAWLSPKTTQTTEADKEESDILSRFDHLFRGNAKIALVALVQKPEPMAIFWSRSGTGKGVFTKLKQGEQIEGLELTRIELKSITLSVGDQHNQLRLFKPVK